MTEISNTDRLGQRTSSDETTRERPVSGGAIDPRIIAEKVYRLMQRDLSVERERTARRRG